MLLDEIRLFIAFFSLSFIMSIKTYCELYLRCSDAACRAPWRRNDRSDTEVHQRTVCCPHGDRAHHLHTPVSPQSPQVTMETE